MNESKRAASAKSRAWSYTSLPRLISLMVIHSSRSVFLMASEREPTSILVGRKRSYLTRLGHFTCVRSKYEPH